MTYYAFGVLKIRTIEMGIIREGKNTAL